MRLLAVSNEGTEYLSADTVGITAEAVLSIEILECRLSGLIIEYLRSKDKQFICVILFVAVLEAFLRRQKSQSLIFSSYTVDKAVKYSRM